MSETAFVGIYIIQDGCLSCVNSILATIFGYTPEELTALILGLSSIPRTMQWC
ncbi:MAG: hypothetical protein IPP54_16010 [Anaerolineales bacterium]|nr:hypothetical protein [Anaerolineales bacterium]